MAFRTFRLRGEKILARVGADGAPLTGADGRVDIVYKQGGKLYRAAARNLEPTPDAQDFTDAEAAPGESTPKEQKKPGHIGNGALSAEAPVDPDAIMAYTDGACTGNPGPMGLGLVLIDPKTKDRRERSEYLGEGTNNIAELVAIQRAMELAPEDRGLVVHSDSSYALGLLGLGWKAKANQALVTELRAIAAKRTQLRFVKVAGHSGVVENERADELARNAVDRRVTRDTHVPHVPPKR